MFQIKKNGLGNIRLGLLKGFKEEIPTPHFLSYSARATPVVLSPKLLKSVSGVDALYMPIGESLVSPGTDILKKYNDFRNNAEGKDNENKEVSIRNGIKSFANLNDFYVFLGLRDILNKDLGPANSERISIASSAGKQQLHLDSYFEFISEAKPDAFVVFSEEVAWDSTKTKVKKAVTRTIGWLDECLKAKEHCEVKINEKRSNKKVKKRKKPINNEDEMELEKDQKTLVLDKELMKKSIMLAAIPGGKYDDCRAFCIDEINKRKGVQGIVWSGFNSGESEAERIHSIQEDIKHIPKELFKVLISEGTPSEVIEAVECGVDMFVGLYPHSMTEKGFALSFPLEINNKTAVYRNLNDIEYREKNESLVANCKCHACIHHTCAYIHHLLRTKEITGKILLEIHNLHYYSNFFRQISESVQNSTFGLFKETILKSFKY